MFKLGLKLNLFAFLTIKYDVSTLKNDVNMMHCMTWIGSLSFNKAQHLKITERN